MDPLRPLVYNELSEEEIFPVQSHRPVDAGDFEVTVIARVNYVDVLGEADSRDNHIRDLHHSIIPEKQNTSTCSDGRPPSEAFESISPQNIASVQLRNGL
jgi:hypothetical protein